MPAPNFQIIGSGSILTTRIDYLKTANVIDFNAEILEVGGEYIARVNFAGTDRDWPIFFGEAAYSADQTALAAKLLKPAFELMSEHSHDNAAFYVWHASSTRRDFEWAIQTAGLDELQYLTWVKDSFVMGHADYHWQTEPCFYLQKAGHRAAFFGDRKQSTVWRLSRAASESGATINLANGIHLSDGDQTNLYLKANISKAAGKLRHIRLGPGESCNVLSTSSTDAWEIKRDSGSDYFHPNQKPPELALRAIWNSTAAKEAIVADCFSGSGSTLIACERSHRSARAIELDPKFAAGIIERWHLETGNTPTNDTPGAPRKTKR